ncbi:MAG: hypothetical protein LBO72_09025 [Helicobacteraceae bacterium]|jgi:hypothetical protein|nr:hypothetical protein [Helicobacteraceae bacterium]
MKRFKFLRVLCAFALLSAFAIGGEKECHGLDFGEDVFMQGYSCFYPAQTILEAYADFRTGYIKERVEGRDSKKLRAKLEIGKNYEDNYKELKENEYIYGIVYKWDGDKKLNIEILAEAGEGEIKFTQENNGTTMTDMFYSQ